jgi:ketosteroid isomerase-like protein
LRSLEQRICVIEDVECIRKLKFEYAKRVDAKDADGIAELFTEDAVWDGGPDFGRPEGREAIRGYFREVWKRLGWSVHIITNPQIEVESVDASGLWCLLEPATLDGRALWIVGRYTDHYRKVDGKWLFARVTLSLDSLASFEYEWPKGPFTRE